MIQVSRLLVLLSLISLTSSAQSESAIQTTSNGQSAVFHLPNSDTVVVGFRTEHLWTVINYKVCYQGKQILKKELKPFQWKSQWLPLHIGTKVINGTNLEDPQGLDKRYVSLSSTEEVHWQMMTLPLKDHELQKATPGEEVFLDIPEEGDVWVAVWNKLGREFIIVLRLLKEQEKYIYFNIYASKDWSIICINDERILYGNIYYNHLVSNEGLKGRRLQMKSDSEVHFQVFPVPLKSTDAAPPPENTGISDAASQPVTLLIALAVVATSVVILGTFFGCRFFWKKRNRGPTEGATVAMSTINNPSSANKGLVPTAEHFGESSFHVSENRLYGFVIRR